MYGRDMLGPEPREHGPERWTPEAPPPPKLSRMDKGLLAVGGIIAAGIVTWGIVRARRGPFVPFVPAECEAVTSRGGHLAGFRYLERVTRGADPESPLPMIVLFHSRGSRPENHAGMFAQSLGQPVRVILPEGPHRLGKRRSWTERASRTKDQGAWADELEALGEDMAQFVYEATQCRPTLGAPIVTGSSEGGHMAYLMATLYPDLVRGGVAVAGYLPEDLWHHSMAPTVGLHGTRDTAVPYGRTEYYWQTMEAEGAPIRYRAFSGVGHAVPSSVSRAWREALGDLLPPGRGTVVA